MIVARIMMFPPGLDLAVQPIGVNNHAAAIIVRMPDLESTKLQSRIHG
jgi:hypothetical protein